MNNILVLALFGLVLWSAVSGPITVAATLGRSAGEAYVAFAESCRCLPGRP